MKFRPRFRRSRRIRKGKREYIWVTSDTSIFLGGTGTMAAPGQVLVDASDWARDPTAAGHVEKGAVIQRVVGTLSVGYEADNAPPNSVDVNFWWAGIRVADNDDSGGTLTLSDGRAFEESWMQLFTGTIQRTVEPVATLTWAAADFQSLKDHAVDIRVKRKLDTTQQLVWTAGSTPAGAGDPATDVMYRLGVRVLLVLP